MRPKGSQVAQDGPEMTQDALRWPQGALGKSKDGPGWPQGKAWRAQDGHKGARDGPKMAPRWSQDGPKMAPREVKMRSRWTKIAQGSRS